MIANRLRPDSASTSVGDPFVCSHAGRCGVRSVDTAGMVRPAVANAIAPWLTRIRDWA